MAYGPWGNEVSSSSRFSGTWITDPGNPGETVVTLRYGGLGRQNSRDRAKTALQFVGRSYPVYDVGDARAESVNVDTTLSNEDGDVAEMLILLQYMIGDGKVVLYRDGRGRKIYAVGSDFQVEDLEQGSYRVTFLLNRVDFDEALPEATSTPPVVLDTQPKNLSVTVDNYSGMALVNWDAIGDTQIYHLYINGVEVGSTSENATTYGPLESGEYTMTVSAVVGGVESIQSAPFAFNVARPTPDPGGGGGGTTPPTTVPQNFRAFPQADNRVPLQWDPVPGATQYQIFEVRSPAGVTNGITTATTMIRGPLGDGPFDYWVKAMVGGVWSASSNHQQFTLPYDGGPISGGGSGGGDPGGGGTPTPGAMPSPVEVLGLRNGDAGYLHYNLGCGFTDSKGHKDYDPQTLEDWSTTTATELKDNYWTLIDAAGKYVVAMTVEPGAAKTSANTSYPRCEHREMAETSSGNTNKANWTPTTGDHDFSGFSRIMTLPPAKPGVCINQLHDQSDDVVMIKSLALSGKIAIVLDVYGARVAVLQADFTLAREIYSRIRINAGALSVYYSQSASSTTSASVTTSTAYTGTVTNTNPPWYHKFGCYAQSNDSTDTSGTKCLVYVRDWKQWHTGWPAPVTGNYTGPGGSGGTGAPIVSAGADATVAPGGTFSRTGQVVGSGITAQGWRLVGAGASTTDQSTAAGKLGWGVPSAESDEFNYTGAPDPVKWGVYDGSGHDGNGVRSSQRISVANGICTITGLAGSANTGGMEHKLDRQYGKWEFRAKSYYTADPAAPGDKTGGYHPVGEIWSDHASWPLDGEYNVLENGEPGQQAAGAFLHYPSLSGGDHQIDVPDYPVDLRQWHNFAIEWTSTFIKLYVDGLLWYTASGGSAADRKNIQAMSAGHLTLQLDAFQAIGLIGSAMQFEWVRTYPVTPVTSNPQLSSSSQVNYIVPTTPGTYTLEFFATNASGTSTDQVAITVGTPTGGGEPGTVQTRGIGGIPTPAPASNVVLVGSDTTAKMKITTGGKIYDGQGHKVGSVEILADNVTFQNFDVQQGTGPGIYSMGTGNTIQNNKITQIAPPSDGDINGITFFGDDTEILFNDIGTDASTLVKGSTTGHTDGIQTWNTSSKRSSSNVLIKGNRIPSPGASDNKRIHQDVMAEGGDSTDGGGGGTGVSQNWTVEDNIFYAYGGAQTLKFDDIHNVTIRRNTFAGSTTKIVAIGSLSTGINFVTSGADANIITGSYGSTVGS